MDNNDGRKLELMVTVVVTGGGDKVVVVAGREIVTVVGGGRAGRRGQSEYMRLVKGEKGQTREGCDDGGENGGEATGD